MFVSVCVYMYSFPMKSELSLRRLRAHLPFPWRPRSFSTASPFQRHSTLACVQFKRALASTLRSQTAGIYMYMYMYMYVWPNVYMWLVRKSILLGPHKLSWLERCPYFQRLTCTQEYTIGTSETVLIREASLHAFQRGSSTVYWKYCASAHNVIIMTKSDQSPKMLISKSKLVLHT